MSVAIVTTTIFVPKLLQAYCKNAHDHAHDDLRLVVIGDRKTPAEVGGFCAQLAATSGYAIDYQDLQAQERYLSRFPALRSHLPYDSIQRRNIGLLRAYEFGADVVITIDDDNLVGDDDFVGAHCSVGTEIEHTEVRADGGWFNVCQLLEERSGMTFFHRGYPHSMRQTLDHKSRRTTAKVVVNAGLWLGDPDVDAVARMNAQLEAISVTPAGADGVVLAKGTWSPFNSQNTALSRSAIPAYFLSPYVGRYDDIWGSYFLRVIMDHLGDSVRYGPPIVVQERNLHDHWLDLEQEQLGMRLTDRLVEGLRSVVLSGSTYQECYAELTDWLKGTFVSSEELEEDQRVALRLMGEGMSIWNDAMSAVKD
jgi:hypothetical protein